MSLQTQQANAGQSGPPSPGSMDNLTCQWQGCTQPNHQSPEKLYEHVCETHIGRKSTNNLNLQCFWGSCRTTTVKRDHITSHIRVHVPLKPHKCDFCGKSFKRPQDLKKHVKTHADESVLLNSPQSGGPRAQPNGYHGQANGKSSGFYGDGGMGSHVNYAAAGYPNMQAGYNHFAGAPQVGMHGQNYGGGHYGVPQMSSYGASGLTESRKRTHDALNDFFGDIKRRNIDAGQFQDFSARFGSYLNMMGPQGFQGGYQGGFNPGYGGGGMDAGGGLAYQTAQHPPAMMNPYNMQFSELRTKNDLLSIDQFLEQLQNTVFDGSAADSAAAMMPMSHMQQPGPVAATQNRGSHSPPRMNIPSAATPGAYSTPSLTASSNMEEITPAVTPSSFQASHSPSSSHQNISPSSRPSGSVGYPALPSFSMLENHTNQFAQSGAMGGVPPSGLGSQYEEYEARRRHSAGLLQRAQRASPPETRESEKVASPKSREGGEVKEAGESKGSETSGSPSQSAVKLPGVAQITGGEADKQARGEEGTERAEREESPRARNMRMIQNLKQYIKARLERGEYHSSDAGSGKSTPRAQTEDTDMVDADMDADDRSSGEGSTPKRTGPGIAYPNLEA